MLEEKLDTMKTELKAVSSKEKELHDALLQTQELRLKYIGAIEVLEQLKEEESAKKKVK
tara:strand:+ start:27 stop:203 length:177 start_codon:yes stop_codon:yes gene_type:complete